ncbi:MAG: energy transducer TonB [Methylobacter sp.]|nr:energy transducer TonB [Candidatus Methylobacter titanis]
MKSSVAALLTGILVSLGLFWLMQFMLMSNQHVVKKTEHLNMMEFVRLKREPPPPKPKIEKPPEKKVEQVQDKPPPPQRQKAPPKKQPVIQKAPVVKQEIPAMDVPKLDIPVQAVKSSGPAVNASGTAGTAGTASGTGETGNAQGDVDGKGAASGGDSTGVIPLERVPPKYPRGAANRHIEGWVKVEFTITTDGDVEDAVVIEAQPADIFDNAALQAISRWKFKGKMVNGVRVTQRAVQTLQFKLTK